METADELVPKGPCEQNVADAKKFGLTILNRGRSQTAPTAALFELIHTVIDHARGFLQSLAFPDLTIH
jgi:hypothetical protein